MKKTTKTIIIIAVVAVIAIVIAAVLFLNNGSKSNLEPITASEGLVALIDKVYEGQTNLLPSLQSQVIDVADTNTVTYVTGLENSQDIEFLAVSEPMMSSQAYSLMVAKVKEGVNPSTVAKTMCDSANMNKWVCVSAEKLYATNSGDVVFLVMSSEEMAKPVYESFKTLAGNIGEEYERTAEEIELPDEMY